jgi:hypothetical protein
MFCTGPSNAKCWDAPSGMVRRGGPRPMAWGTGKKIEILHRRSPPRRPRPPVSPQPSEIQNPSRQPATASPPPPLPSPSRRPPPRALPTSLNPVLAWAWPSAVRRRRRARAPCGLRRWRGVGVRPRLASPARPVGSRPSGHARTRRAAAACRGAACGSPRPPGHAIIG